MMNRNAIAEANKLTRQLSVTRENGSRKAWRFWELTSSTAYMPIETARKL